MIKAAKQTYHLAVTTLALVLSHSAMAGLKEGVEAYQAGDMALAAKEFRAAAEQGDTDCQYNMALMYEQGVGVAKDDKEAHAWYKKAAEIGHPYAQFNLGVMYENGRGCAVDFALANHWYRKAASQGDALAFANLGMLYIRGDGVKVNKVAGIALLLQSVAMDNSPENHARRNISGTSGLTPEIIGAAQALAEKFDDIPNFQAPLDEYLKSTGAAASIEASK